MFKAEEYSTGQFSILGIAGIGVIALIISILKIKIFGIILASALIGLTAFLFWDTLRKTTVPVTENFNFNFNFNITKNKKYRIKNNSTNKYGYRLKSYPKHLL